MTDTTYKILKAIEKGTYDRGIDAKAIALTLWRNDPEHNYLCNVKNIRMDYFTINHNLKNVI